MRTQLAAISAAALVLLVPVAAHAAPSGTAPGQNKPGHYSFAVIGDVPYGAAQIAEFPALVDQINAGQPEFTVHLGDIKNGSTRCDNGVYTNVKAGFDRFTNPLIYSPGDNEWTDCHRANNGAYNPLERLAFDRSIFFANPGMTLGQKPMRLASQVNAGFPENVRWREQGVDFAALHVVGSNDDLLAWNGIGKTAPTAEQVAEESARMANAVTQVHATFADARQRQDRAVALFMQADMFDPTYSVTWADNSAFKPLVEALIQESSTFSGDVYLFNGDSHVYNSDRPLAAGSAWLAFYGVTGSADNLRRITVDGSGVADKDWLKVTVNRPGAAETLSWERIPYTH